MNNNNKKLINYALSDRDINHSIRTNIIWYHDLNNIHNIDDIFINNSCVILIKNKGMNHWVCVIKNGNYIEFFDSYGNTENNLKNYFDKKYLKQTNQIKNNINKLMFYSNPNYELHYNNIKYQSDNQNIATCGRHCIIRIMYKNLTDKEYKNFIYKNCKKYEISPDYLVLRMTNKII
jgi:hypothetical protein